MHPVEQFLEILSAKWNEEEELFRRRGQVALADFIESIRHDTTAMSAAWLDEPIGLQEAADIGRYGYSHLQHLLRDGRVPNAGERHRPRVLRRHIPIKVEMATARALESGHEEERLAETADPVMDLVESELLAMERDLHEPDLG